MWYGPTSSEYFYYRKMPWHSAVEFPDTNWNSLVPEWLQAAQALRQQSGPPSSCRLHHSPHNTVSFLKSLDSCTEQFQLCYRTSKSSLASPRCTAVFFQSLITLKTSFVQTLSNAGDDFRSVAVSQRWRGAGVPSHISWTPRQSSNSPICLTVDRWKSMSS